MTRDILLAAFVVVFGIVFGVFLFGDLADGGEWPSLLSIFGYLLLLVPMMLLPFLFASGALSRWRTPRTRSRELLEERLATRIGRARAQGERWVDPGAEARVEARSEPRVERGISREPGGRPPLAPKPIGATLWAALLWPLAIAWFIVFAGLGCRTAGGSEGNAGIFGLVLLMFSWLPMAFLFFRHRPDREQAAQRHERAKARLRSRLGDRR